MLNFRRNDSFQLSLDFYHFKGLVSSVILKRLNLKNPCISCTNEKKRHAQRISSKQYDFLGFPSMLRSPYGGFQFPVT